MKFVKPDFIPMLADAGLDETILAAIRHQVTVDELRVLVNRATDLELENDDIVLYVAERGGLGLSVLDGDLPPATARPDAPTGLGQDGVSVWFSEPSTGIHTLRWYVDGALLIEREQDLALDRSATKAELGDPAPGSIVQVCEVSAGVVGWWARLEIE